MSATFLFFTLLFWKSSVWAASQAIVVIDGAMVYQAADFDSPVIGYFSRGKKVKVSEKGFGPFRRVAFKQGVFGYISDVDIVGMDGLPLTSEGSSAKVEKGKRNESKSEASNAETADKEESPKVETKKKSKVAASGSLDLLAIPVGHVRALGPIYSYINYREFLGRQTYSENLTAFGIKWSGPMPFFDGPFGLDVDFLYHYGAPTYYNSVSNSPPTGFLIFNDYVAHYPFISFWKRDGVFRLGAGPLLAYSDISTNLGGLPYRYSDLKLGLSVVASLGVRYQRFIGRLEAKYYVEKSNYLGYQAAIQYQF